MTGEPDIQGHTVIRGIDYFRFALGMPRQMVLELMAISIVVAFAYFFFRDEFSLVTVGGFFGRVALITGSVFVIGNLVFGGLVALRWLRYTGAQKSVHYRIDCTFVMLRSDAGSESKLPWTLIKKLKRRSDGLLVVAKPMGKVWLPARAFDSAAFSRISEIASSIGVQIR